ncbi:MAG: TIGR03557 family F420-dependent LLM class oxidoreductase [Acidimicrobiia bacterium]
MISIGYTLSAEEQPPRALVAHAQRAEAAGFDFVSMSDHYHPWVQAQGHSPFVWSVLGAVAATTERIDVGIGVTCPIMRIHPAVVAQAAATTSLLLEGRFFLGVGAGELLNEHIVGLRWPPPETRMLMLGEAVDVMRALWTGETVDHHGQFFTVENARLFDPPTRPVPVVVSGFGAAATELAARIGDGFWSVQPAPDLPGRYEQAGGTGPRIAQMTVCVAPTVEEGRRTLREQWPNAGVKGQAASDLPTWSHFEQVSEDLTEDQVVGDAPCGPDAESILKSVQQYLDAGYDRLYFHQVGPDQSAFFALWEDGLGAEVRDLVG